VLHFGYNISASKIYLSVGVFSACFIMIIKKCSQLAGFVSICVKSMSVLSQMPFSYLPKLLAIYSVVDGE